MSNVYFVRTDHVYDSYADYFTLAVLSGYSIVTFDQIDIDSDNTYIVTPLSGEWEKRWDHPVKCNIILHDLEWRLKESDYAWPESALVTPPFVSRVWASDKWYAERIGAEYVPLGSHPGLVGNAPIEQTYDLAPLAYIYGRRQAILERTAAHGVTMAPTTWGEARDAALKGSTAMIHVHQHERVPTVAPLRYALAAAYNKPLISEAVLDRGIFDGAVLFADKDTLPEYAALMVKRYPHLLRDRAEELHDRLCVSNSFRSYIEGAL